MVVTQAEVATITCPKALYGMSNLPNSPKVSILTLDFAAAILLWLTSVTGLCVHFAHHLAKLVYIKTIVFFVFHCA